MEEWQGFKSSHMFLCISHKLGSHINTEARLSNMSTLCSKNVFQNNLKPQPRVEPATGTSTEVVVLKLPKPKS